MSVAAPSLIESRWDHAAASNLSDLELLVYASNLLGSDLRITNFGGGNTSSKVSASDPLTGDPTRVLWVKASGGDLGSAKASNFASLYLGRLLSLKAKSVAGVHEDEIVGLYGQCIFNLNPAAPSIDTPLHALVPAPCVSHMHSDAVIAIAACDHAEQLTKEIWGGRMGYLPWKRPGFDLGLMLERLIEENPGIQGALMQSHGFICWAGDWESCYRLTLDMINDAQKYMDGRGTKEPFGPSIRDAEVRESNAQWESLLPALRGKVAHNGQRLVACLDRDNVTLDFLSREKLVQLAGMGTSCPDHFLRTKIRPLVIELPKDGLGPEALDEALAEFREAYHGYYERCRRPDSPAIRNPNPSVVLVPGLGMVSFGKNAQEAKVTGQFYRNAIEVMRGAESVGKYVALPEQEAFDIEYWLLEEAKLRRMPQEKELSGSIAAITGGAQGIGLATAKKMAALGACVAILDIQEDKLEGAVSEIQACSGVPGSVMGIQCNVTETESVRAAFGAVIRTFGGVDIAVIGAGNARRGSLADTTDADYDFLSNLLMKGYALAMREAIRVMQDQGTGGSIVVVGSKNGVATGSNAAIYSAAKAFELHLMRTVAVDHAKDGIRCNAINPDAVLTGSAIWSDQWRTETAALLGISPNQLEDHYRKRSLLGVAVSTDDCAEAICWLASETRSSRTTGCVIPVDGGNREGFLR
jgi:rhamnulose-1-phosphate aldolase/alcohol dehydrogenase